MHGGVISIRLCIFRPRLYHTKTSRGGLKMTSTPVTRWEDDIEIDSRTALLENTDFLQTQNFLSNFLILSR